jgi:hypothetical protein
MNKIISTSIAISLIYIFAMCSSDDEVSSDPPVKIKHDSGFLGTIGVYASGKVDTICIRMNTSGTAYNITTFSSDTESDGYIERPRDIFTLSNDGANQWHIKNGSGKYLGISDFEEDEDYYSTTFYETINEAAIFVMNADADGQFYLEPVVKRGFYLNTLPFADYPEHEFMDFIPEKKQKWFILP